MHYGACKKAQNGAIPVPGANHNHRQAIIFRHLKTLLGVKKTTHPGFFTHQISQEC